MLNPTAGQSMIRLGVSLLGWLMGTSLIYAQSALQFSNPAGTQSTVALKAAATAFRVDTDIYMKSSSKAPDKQTLTLFKEGVYYDFPMDDEKQTVTMTDPLGGRIVMLSPSRQLKTVFKTAELASRMEALKRDIATKKELAKMLTPPVTSEGNQLRVGDEAFAYQATLQSARDASMVSQYADFADWQIQLSAILPPNFPPFVRMVLNREVAERNALPDTIERITRHNGTTSVIRSKLVVNAVLSSDDEAKIRLVGEMLQRCKEVSQAEFFTNPAKIARDGSPLTNTK